MAQKQKKSADEPYSVPENWRWLMLGSISEFERGITFPAAAKEFEATKDNIPCLRTANVQENLDTNDLIYVDKSYMKANAAKFVRLNDIIMSSANSRELVGKTCFVSSIETPMTFGGFILTIRAKKILSKYLFYNLRLSFLLGKFISKATQTINIANINSKTLQNFPIPLPPLPEQERIVNIIESLFKDLDEAKEKLLKLKKVSAKEKPPCFTKPLQANLLKNGEMLMGLGLRVGRIKH